MGLMLVLLLVLVMLLLVAADGRHSEPSGEVEAGGCVC